MLIGELADIAGVTCQTVRFYERRGLLPDAEPPTSYSVDGGELLAMQALCHGVVTWQRLEELKRAGARGLMVLPVERMLA